MSDEKYSQVHTTCYQTGGGKTLFWLAAGLIALGVLLAVLCIPLWLWLAAAGAALIVLGILLLRK